MGREIPSVRAREDAELIERIVEIHGKHRRVYGAPRIAVSPHTLERACAPVRDRIALRAADPG
jgi:hypothetical protein